MMMIDDDDGDDDMVLDKEAFLESMNWQTFVKKSKGKSIFSSASYVQHLT